jgi:hypothetical protein
VHCGRLGAPFRALSPGSHRIDERLRCRIVGAIPRRWRHLDGRERGRLWPRQVDAVGPVVREEVLGLPGGETARQVEHRRTGEDFTGEILASQYSFVGGEHSRRSRRGVRREVGPLVCRRCHLGQGAGGEPPRALDQDRRRVASRRLEGEAELGVRGDGPQLAPALHGLFASVAQLDEPVPLAIRAQRVHEPDELVDVAALDCGRDRFGRGHRRLTRRCRRARGGTHRPLPSSRRVP